MAVNPTREDFKRFFEEDDGGPIVMLNLLRFRGDGGRASYERYIEETGSLLTDGGAAVLYAGECSTSLVDGGENWDAIILVRYPSRSAFAEIIKGPAYQAVTHYRTEGLEAAVLQATTPWSTAGGDA